MRTVKVTYDIDMGSGNKLTFGTEVIVTTDEEAEEAGEDAFRFLRRFNNGMEAAAADESSTNP